MRRGQTEVVGLIVIVLLLLIVGVIFIRFSLLEKPDVYSDLRTNIQASNLLNAIMKADSEMGRLSNVMAGCREKKEDGRYFEGEVKQIIRGSLDIRTDFNFLGYGDGKEIINIGGCKTGVYSSYPYTRDNVFYEAKLKICKN